MKVSIIALAFTAFTALAASAMTVSAYAANPAVNSATANSGSYDAQQATQWAPVQPATTAKTRAEVRQELVRAQKDGQLAALSKIYQGS